MDEQTENRVYMDIKIFIEAAQKRPVMYMKNLCLDEFLDYIFAMLSTKKMFEIEEKNDRIFSENIGEWICKKYNFDKKYSGKWDHIIHMHSLDNEDALYNFFKCFNEFSKEYFTN